MVAAAACLPDVGMPDALWGADPAPGPSLTQLAQRPDCEVSDKAIFEDLCSASISVFQ